MSATCAGASTPKKKQSSFRHTRAIRHDRIKRPLSLPPDEQVTERLCELIHPATLAQLAHLSRLNLRQRLLTLPVVVALVLTMIWRQVGSVSELVRELRREGFLWISPVRVSQQALSQRLRTFPAELFQRVLLEVLPLLHARSEARERPLPKVIAWAKERYSQVLAFDGSTLDALMRQVGLLRDAVANGASPLAGRMTALLDLCSRLPREVWYEEDPQAHDQRFWPRVLAALPQGALVLFDLGYTNFQRFSELTARGITWITRAKRNLVYEVERVLLQTPQARDRRVWIGQGAECQRVRLVEVLVGRHWYRYLTNELDSGRLPAAYVAALYAERWGIEEAYAVTKRLLGLAYFWVGSANGVQLQLWATWLLYAVLVDLTDALAEALRLPLQALSMEMVFRGLYHFTRAFHRGEASDPIAYLAAPENQDLGVVKRARKYRMDSAKSNLLTLLPAA